MKIDSKDLLNSIFQNLSELKMPHSDQLPNIDLYMDQVTTYMERYLSVSKRHEEDKILTKTMINNYAKNNLLPPPEKKKYTKEHILTLIFIYYFKNLLSISDIQALLNPLTQLYFNEDSPYSYENIYDEILNLAKGELEDFKDDIIRKFAKSNTSFPEAKKSEEEFLHQFSMICMLSVDIYLKKQIVEQMIDSMSEIQDKEKEAAKKEATKKEAAKKEAAKKAAAKKELLKKEALKKEAPKKEIPKKEIPKKETKK